MFYITVSNVFNVWLVSVEHCFPSFLFRIGHRAEKEKLCQMQEHYERLLKKAKDELEKLRKQVDESHQKLSFTQKWYVFCRNDAVYQGREFFKR